MISMMQKTKRKAGVPKGGSASDGARVSSSYLTRGRLSKIAKPCHIVGRQFDSVSRLVIP